MSAWMRAARAGLLWLVVGVLSAGVVTVAMLPAAWIVPLFARASGGHVNLVEPSGSLWRGSAALMLAAGPDESGATLLPGRLEWRTAFWPLFTGRVEMWMRQTDTMPDAVTLAATLRETTLSAGAMAVPAPLLNGLGAPFNTLDLNGDVRLAWSAWRVFGTHVFGHLTVTLLDMSTRLSTLAPLGSWQLALDAQGETAALALTTLKGPLTMSGVGQIGAQGFSFNGRASADAASRENLAGLLNLLGDPAGPGMVSLQFGSNATGGLRRR